MGCDIVVLCCAAGAAVFSMFSAASGRPFLQDLLFLLWRQRGLQIGPGGGHNSYYGNTAVL